MRKFKIVGTNMTVEADSISEALSKALTLVSNADIVEV